MQYILAVMDRTAPPWNVSRLARELSRERPAHTYSSYQTFLQKNMLDRLNLQQRLRERHAERGGHLDGVHIPRTSRARSAQPAASERPARRPRVAGGLSVGELHATFAPRSSSVESLDELDEDGAAEAADAPPAESSSEEEPMDEAEMLAFEARQTHVDAPRPAPHRRRHEAFLPEEHEQLVNRLVDLLVETHWGRDADADGTVNVDEEPPVPPPAFWDEMSRIAPRHSARSWMLHFERSAPTFWRTATDRFLLRMSPSSLFVDAERSVVQSGDESAARASQPDVPAADESRVADESQPAPQSDAPPDASQPTPQASGSAAPAGPSASTPMRPARRMAHAHNTPRASWGDAEAAAAVHTPKSHGPAYTPYSVRVGQRRDHHDAKAHARERHDAEFGSAAPSPLGRRTPASAPPARPAAPVEATPPSPVRRVRHSLGAPGAPGWPSLQPWRSEATRASQYGVEQRRARAEYEARVWELCSDFALTSPAQLVPFMEPAHGDVERCREAVEEYIDALADYYDTERTTILELLEAQLGSFEQVVRVLDIQQRSLERSMERSRERTH